MNGREDWLPFDDREDAGRRLGAVLANRSIDADVVLAVPRGGIPVGREVAEVLDVPLDVVVAAKVPAPWNPELAIGAVGSEGTVWLDEGMIEAAEIDREYVSSKCTEVSEVVTAKERRYGGASGPRRLDGQTVVIVDDGAATGATAIASVRVATARGARQIIVALPVATVDAATALEGEGAVVVCLFEPTTFRGVGQFYEDFEQVTDEAALVLLDGDS